MLSVATVVMVVRVYFMRKFMVGYFLHCFRLRIQSLLCLKLFQLKRPEVLKFKKIIDADNTKVSTRKYKVLLSGHVPLSLSPYLYLLLKQHILCCQFGNDTTSPCSDHPSRIF